MRAFALVVWLTLFQVSMSPVVAQTNKTKSSAVVSKTEPTTKTDLKEAEALGKFFGFGAMSLLAIWVCSLLFQLIPFMIALMRGHNNKVPIFLVCFFFSWTCIGWIIALIWAFSDNTVKQRRYRP